VPETGCCDASILRRLGERQAGDFGAAAVAERHSVAKCLTAPYRRT
jgi:hypothetical protein